MRISWLVTVLLLLSVVAMATDATTSGYISPQITPTFSIFPSLTHTPIFTFTFLTTASSTHKFTFIPTFTWIFTSSTSSNPTLPPATVTIIPKTDWAVVGIDAIPLNPQAGDLMVFSMIFTALSSNVPFPQSVYIQCQIDGFGCGAGVVSYQGPVGNERIVSASDYWPATPGVHILTWYVHANNDPNPGNNAMSIQFFVQPPQAPITTAQQTTQTQTMPSFTQPTSTQQTTIIQTSIQTVTPSTTQSSDAISTLLQGYTLPLVAIIALLVILLATQRKQKTATPQPKP